MATEPGVTTTEHPAQVGPTPAEWCRRVLTVLEHEHRDDPVAAHLQMLLTTFLEVQPARQTFAALLARYAGDPRASIAGAAATLQRAWERTCRAEAPCELTLSETLRTLGGLLHEAGARAAYLRVDAGGAVVQGCGPTAYQRTLGPLESCQETAERSALRGQVSSLDPVALGRFETRLRAVGAVLEAQPAQTYELVVGPQVVQVEGDHGYCHVFTADEIAAHLHERTDQREPSVRPPNSREQVKDP
jgi:hypothetical protein